VAEKYKSLPEFKNHEQIIELDDPSSGLKGFIAIHNTALGPALGGTRIFPYVSKLDALKDVLKLSQAMTYKCAISLLPFGGGKGVIIADPSDKNILKILKSYAQTIDKLNGLFHTGEDVGLTERQVQYMLKISPFFIGKSHLAGDPSPFAGESAFLCALVAWKHLTGTDKLSNKTVAIKGVGKTGSSLAKHFAAAGAKVYVTDINGKAVRTLLKEQPSIKFLPLAELMAINADIYCPCAMGNDINKLNITKLKARLVVGTANNQLENIDTAEKLRKMGILHVPDYIANAGGLINVADELLPGGYQLKRVEKNIKKLSFTLKDVLKSSKQKGLNADLVANEKAEAIFMKKPFKAGKKSMP
jgi:leucine dehydrogenase